MLSVLAQGIWRRRNGVFFFKLIVLFSKVEIALSEAMWWCEHPAHPKLREILLLFFSFEQIYIYI